MIIKNVEQLPYFFQIQYGQNLKICLKKMVMAVTYNPPKNVGYAGDNLFNFIDSFLRNCNELISICLLGDFTYIPCHLLPINELLPVEKKNYKQI